MCSDYSPSRRTCSSLLDARHRRQFNASRTDELFQSIVKGRKSWKTLPGGEVVWPPELEAALLEGLASYQPDDSRETRLLGRFPLRNRFISEYIYQKTGMIRSPKQVGSRLQQLRDTCGGKKLMNLLSPRRQAVREPSHTPIDASFHYDADTSSDGSSEPSTPIKSSMVAEGPRRVIICVDFVEDGSEWESGPSAQPRFDWQDEDVIHASQEPRPLRSIDPTIAFVSRKLMSTHSSFVVYCSGAVVHAEKTKMSLVGPVPEVTDGSLIYSTSLVPAYWSKITESQDPTQYLIMQDIYAGDQTSTPVFSAVYKFCHPRQSPPPSPLTPIDGHTSLDGIHHPFVYSTSSCLDTLGVCDTQNAFDYTVLDAKESSPWTWKALGSPCTISTELSSVFEPASPCRDLDGDLDLSLSPVPVCFPSDLSNYASLMNSKSPTPMSFS